MEAAGDTCSLQRFGLTVQLPHLHQTGHLVLCDFDGLAPPFGQADVSYERKQEVQKCDDKTAVDYSQSNYSMLCNELFVKGVNGAQIYGQHDLKL